MDTKVQHKKSPKRPDSDLYFHLRFLEVFNLSCLDFAMNRLLLYTMAHTYKDYQFLPRVVNSLFSYLMAGGAPRGILRPKL